MKIITTLILLTGLATGISPAAEQPRSTPETAAEGSTRNITTNSTPDKVEGSVPTSSATNGSDKLETSSASPTTNALPTGENPDLAALMPEDNGTNGLRLNFR